jgi:AcrR family transcriptional regulator
MSTLRDPERTRERILAAALAEFSRRGFAGARVDAIARRARINKRMLYHYFGDKARLFREILRRKMAARQQIVADAGGPLSQSLPYVFERTCQDADFVRLMQWEALETGAGPLMAEAERRTGLQQARRRLEREQAAGLVPADLDSGQLLLSLLALVAFPMASPQATRLITGRAPTHPRFRAERAVFLRRLSDHLMRAATQQSRRRR